MRIFANKVNGRFLRDVLPPSDAEIDGVKAAIAYGDDASTLVHDCLQNGYRLDIWMRYDHTVPVSPELLEHLLKNVGRNMFCRLVPDVLHSKVIWWKNYGVYIGSANLTERAWISNIEVGVFLSEAELESSGCLQEIEGFFEQIASYQEVIPLTIEIVEDQKKLKAERAAIQAIERRARAARIVPEWDGPTSIADRKTTYARGRDAFLKEWNESLTVLRGIAGRAPMFRPKWLNSDVPATWQADQFLHAYYYNRVKSGAKYLVDEFYEKNVRNPAASVDEALAWWATLPAPPSNEDENCHVNAPTICELLSRQRLQILMAEDFSRVCLANHSTMDHLWRTNLGSLGITIEDDASPEQRAAAFARWIWNRRNAKGERIDQILSYVLDGGRPAEMPARLFEAANAPDRRIPHFGINQLAELAGWARPDMYSPRNGRTSKSLRALGFDVRIY